MKVLITGCNGLVGCRLAKRLVDEGISVFGISQNGLTNPYISPANYYQINISDTDKVSEILEVIKPDILIHAAAITKPDICEANKELCHQINFLSAKNLMDESQNRNIYTIHLSTDFVFAGSDIIHDENTNDFPPVNTYGQSKYEIEKYILSNHPDIAIVRTALVYGYEPLLPRNNIFTWAVDELKKGKPIRVVEDQFRSPTFADDLAEGIYALCQKKLSGIFHIAGKDFMSVYDFVCDAAHVFNFDQNLILPVKTITLNEPAKRLPSTKMDITQAKNLLDYQPKSTIDNLNLLYNQYSH